MKQKNSDKKKTGKEANKENPVTVETGQTTPEVIQNIDLSMIVCSPFNPRKYRTEEDVEELAQSMMNCSITSCFLPQEKKTLRSWALAVNIHFQVTPYPD